MAYRLPTSGRDFEEFVCELFGRLGFEAQLTPASGDYGADVLLRFPSRIRHTIAVQAKFYSKPVDNSPVQEVLASLRYYGAAEGWVVTNSTFTPAARELARVNGVRLIDGGKLNGLLDHIEMYQDCEPLVDDLLAWSGFSELPPAGVSHAVPRSAGVVEVFDRPDVVVAPTAKMPLVEPAEWRSSRSSDGARATQAPKTSRAPRTYNLSEVAVRWGCSQGAVKKHISSGLPMYKMPNGRWAVTEGDLLGYERMLAEREERERRRGTVISLVLIVASLSVLLGVLVYYAYQIGLFTPDALPALREQLLGLAHGAGVLA